jgi:hypothetical protein
LLPGVAINAPLTEQMGANMVDLVKRRLSIPFIVLYILFE